MASKNKTMLKNRLKALKNNRSVNAIVELSKEEQIKDIQSKIRLCQQDLIKFPDNKSILQKIKNYETFIKQLQGGELDEARN